MESFKFKSLILTPLMQEKFLSSIFHLKLKNSKKFTLIKFNGKFQILRFQFLTSLMQMILKIKRNIWSESFNYIILRVQINLRIKFFKITFESKFFIKEFSLSMQCSFVKKRENFKWNSHSMQVMSFSKNYVTEFFTYQNFHVIFLSIHFLFRCIFIHCIY